MQSNLQLSLLVPFQRLKTLALLILVVLWPSKAHNVFSSLISVHKIQRVPRSEKSGRRHSSEVIVARGDIVVPKITLSDKDIEVTIYRGSGAGGQKRNKTDSCIRMHHIPTGITVIAEDSTSQSTNRKKARERLKARLDEMGAVQGANETNAQRSAVFGSTAAWAWVGWRDTVTAANGNKAPMAKTLKRGIPEKLLR